MVDFEELGVAILRTLVLSWMTIRCFSHALLLRDLDDLFRDLASHPTALFSRHPVWLSGLLLSVINFEGRTWSSQLTLIVIIKRIGSSIIDVIIHVQLSLSLRLRPELLLDLLEGLRHLVSLLLVNLGATVAISHVNLVVVIL